VAEEKINKTVHFVFRHNKPQKDATNGQVDLPRNAKIGWI
jgi:hypothetical protein